MGSISTATIATSRRAKCRPIPNGSTVYPRSILASVCTRTGRARGFYLYELNPDNLPAVSKDVIDAIDQTCPIDHSERIDDRPASGGILKPVVSPEARSLWPEAFYIVLKKNPPFVHARGAV
ncbi:MAG: hypothetical protein Ct9H300mP32_0470 [Verrucomicrobiota bacterium]|nr:MAG: hypothetical protein Ct9H300mP32_0470 [Verrucomicrobiota bacterium]